MRNLLNQNRPLSPATVQLATTALTVLFGVAGVIVFLFGFLNLFRASTFLTGLLQLSGGLGLLLAVVLIVRLLADGVMALHRMNDRLLILSDSLTARRAPETPAPAAPAKPARKPARPAAKKPATRAKPAAAKPAEADTQAPKTDTETDA